jgi:hypothetical protein
MTSPDVSALTASVNATRVRTRPDPAVALSARSADAASDCRALTRSSSQHPGDWGRGIARTLEHLAGDVAGTVGEPELGILIGHDVRLQFDADGDGVVIAASLDQPVSGASHAEQHRRAVEDAAHDELSARVSDALARCAGIDTSAVAIEIVPGGVVLRGSVVNMDERNTLVRTVLRVPGVTSIGDALHVPPTSSR